LHEGCLGDTICSGSAAVLSAVTAPTAQYTSKPSAVPTAEPTTEPTPAPTTSTHKSSILSIDFKLDPKSGATIALYLITALSVLVTVYVYKIRGGMSGIVNTKQFQLSYVVIPINVICSISNLCIISTYLTEGGFAVATAYAIVVGRTIISILYMYLIFLIYLSESLKVFLNPSLLIQGRYSWTAVLVVSLLDISCLRFLPWSDSEFACRSNGFPTMWFFRVCMYSQCGVALISVITSDVQTLEVQAIINFLFR
jgi:hypothetical protein